MSLKKNKKREKEEPRLSKHWICPLTSTKTLQSIGDLSKWGGGWLGDVDWLLSSLFMESENFVLLNQRHFSEFCCPSFIIIFLGICWVGFLFCKSFPLSMVRVLLHVLFLFDQINPKAVWKERKGDLLEHNTTLEPLPAWSLSEVAGWKNG